METQEKRSELEKMTTQEKMQECRKLTCKLAGKMQEHDLVESSVRTLLSNFATMIFDTFNSNYDLTGFKLVGHSIELDKKALYYKDSLIENVEFDELFTFVDDLIAFLNSYIRSYERDKGRLIELKEGIEKAL